MMDPKNPKIEFCGATFSHGQDLEAARKQKQCPGRDWEGLGEIASYRGCRLLVIQQVNYGHRSIA